VNSTLLHRVARSHRGFRGLGRLGDSANSSGPSKMPSLNALGWTDAQKVAASILADSVNTAPPFLDQNISLFQPPADSLPFFQNPPGNTNYPAPGAAAVPILTYQAAVGVLAVVNKIAIVHLGGNDPTGNGNVTWSVTINGAGVAGLGQIQYQVGTLAAPNDIVLLLSENDVLQVLVAVNNVAQTGQTTALIHGWTYPISRATLPSPSQV
jgi:hypothetical protein